MTFPRLASFCVWLLLVSYPRRALPLETTPATAAGQRWQVELLEKYGVQVNAEGLIAYLQDLTPSPKTRAAIAARIRLLGHPNFFIRENATTSLERLGPIAQRQLLRARADDDLEIAIRARRVLHQIHLTRPESLHASLVLAALELLKAHQTPLATETILEIMPLLDRDFQRHAACEALWLSAQPSQAALLRGAVNQGAEEVKAAAIPALEVALGKAAVRELKPFLRDESPDVRLAAARALVNHLPQESLEILLSFIEAEDWNLRLQATWLLSRLRRESGTSDELEIAAQMKYWRQWARTRDPAVLHLPLGVERLEVGLYRSRFHETFDESMISLRDRYRRFQYETNVGGKAMVADGLLRLDGNHAEGDQRLFVTALRLVGQPEFPNTFEVRATLGGEEGNSGGWHVGVSLGNVRFLFHPGHGGGAFRAERIDNQKYLISNQSMPFTPVTGVLHDMRLQVRNYPNFVFVDIAIVNGENPNEVHRINRFVVRREDMGPLHRIALERSGRTGGDALFGALTIDLSAGFAQPHGNDGATWYDYSGVVFTGRDRYTDRRRALLTNGVLC